MYYFYIVRCSDDTLYCGTTNDVEKRVAAHNTSARAAKYTRSRRPVALAYTEAFPDKSTALKREYEVRHWNRPRKEELIASRPHSV